MDLGFCQTCVRLQATKMVMKMADNNMESDFDEKVTDNKMEGENNENMTESDHTEFRCSLVKKF